MLLIISSTYGPFLMVEATIKKNWESLFKSRTKLDKKDLTTFVNDLKNEFKIIQVVGTNGKGSVSSFIAEGLMDANYKVGLFTSPHLFNPNERIKINNEAISDVDFFRIYQELPKGQFFEMLLLSSLVYFNEQNIDVVILEAGIGAKMDVTNILDGGIGVLTSIGLDHQAILGNTKKEIALDKSHIMNQNMNFYYPSSIDDNLKNVFASGAAKNVEVPVKGNYSQQNKSLASFVLLHEFDIYKTNFRDLIGRTTIKKIDDTNYIFDVAHNRQAIEATINKLEDANLSYDNIVIALQSKKDVGNINDLLPSSKNIKYYKPNDQFRDFAEYQEIKDVRNIIGSTLFIGSFIFIGEIYEYFK